MDIRRERKRVGISIRQMWGQLQGFAGILTSLLSCLAFRTFFYIEAHPCISLVHSLVQYKLQGTVWHNILKPTQWGEKAENRAVSLLLYPCTTVSFSPTYSVQKPTSESRRHQKSVTVCKTEFRMPKASIIKNLRRFPLSCSYIYYLCIVCLVSYVSWVMCVLRYVCLELCVSWVMCVLSYV